MKKFTLFLSNICNSLLTKDVGLIPFVMQKYYNYSSSIITMHKEDNLIDNNIYLDNMPIELVLNEDYLVESLKKTDVLMLIGIYDFNLDIINKYKTINPKGTIYLKLDANRYWMNRLNQNIDPFIIETLKKCDLITVEDSKLQKFLNLNWGLNIQVILNGYYDFTPEKTVKYEDKKNTILFVGRVGSSDKANHILVEAFKIIQNKLTNWNLELVGTIEPAFLNYLNKCFEQNPNLIQKIILTGKLNKFELKKRYEKAKIFCLTSPCEACANVFSEAISNGCYLISSDVDGALDITNFGKYGTIMSANNEHTLSEILLKICTDDNLLKNNCINSQIYAQNNLKWIDICSKLNNLIIHV
ncbi:glycosyltransferase family 4 protein [Clostridium weizhouense]|uniref:Glycosyltransferase n=1 Tax=Clostridium weizhouense TaxID=2859781 RepID=A0ABS7AKR2_9CLOT|nr:glycosyltransferase [Clostridium weizhouense]MBW6409247.1 glycosyltransferase [Clostridium weizhouense]